MSANGNDILTLLRREPERWNILGAHYTGPVSSLFYKRKKGRSVVIGGLAGSVKTVWACEKRNFIKLSWWDKFRIKNVADRIILKRI